MYILSPNTTFSPFETSNGVVGCSYTTLLLASMLTTGSLCVVATSLIFAVNFFNTRLFSITLSNITFSVASLSAMFTSFACFSTLATFTSSLSNLDFLVVVFNSICTSLKLTTSVLS